MRATPTFVNKYIIGFKGERVFQTIKVLLQDNYYRVYLLAINDPPSARYYPLSSKVKRCVFKSNYEIFWLITLGPQQKKFLPGSKWVFHMLLFFKKYPPFFSTPKVGEAPFFNKLSGEIDEAAAPLKGRGVILSPSVVPVISRKVGITSQPVKRQNERVIKLICN